MKQLFFLFTTCIVALTIQAQSKTQYVDLGLPSGTLWKQTKETGTYTYDDAIRYFDGFLPSSGQFNELMENCKWEWTGRGYKVIGRNGRSIYLYVGDEKSFSAYHSKTKDDNDGFFNLLCYKIRVRINRSRDKDVKLQVILCK